MANGNTNQTFAAINIFPDNALCNYNVIATTATSCIFTNSLHVFFVNCTGLTDLKKMLHRECT